MEKSNEKQINKNKIKKKKPIKTKEIKEIKCEEIENSFDIFELNNDANFPEIYLGSHSELEIIFFHFFVDLKRLSNNQIKNFNIDKYRFQICQLKKKLVTKEEFWEMVYKRIDKCKSNKN